MSSDNCILRSVVILACVAACTSPERHAAVPDESARKALLVRDLSEQVRGSQLALDTSRIRVTSWPSVAVPGLRYSFAEYHPPERRHARLTALAGARGRLARVIRTEADFNALAGEWKASTSANAIAGCEEAVLSTGFAEFARPPFFTSRSSADSAFLPDEAIQLARAARPPNAVETGSGWRVALWALRRGDPRGGVRYVCDLPRNSSQAVGQLVRTDSLVFPELPD